MKWRKLGRVFTAGGQRAWMQSHCSMPFAEPLPSGRHRVWFTPRDAANRSHLGWLEIDLDDPQTVAALAETPTLAPGPAGSFDETGAMGSWLVTAGAERRHYYIGWRQSTRDPFHIAIGLATGRADNDGKAGTVFKRSGDTPVFDRNSADPIFVSTPCVLPDGAGWRMWYLSATRWRGAPPKPDYNIRHAVSPDGISWTSDGVAIDFDHAGECAIARPCVVRDGAIWRMWYCYRGDEFPYRLGYAESPNGRLWTRQDDRAGLAISDSGWDSEMIAYPYVFDHDGRRYMLYAGNGFGAAGMGLAILESD
jgi:hypothetical protein